ncbi:aspartate/glutamate racemase family protein [Rhizobium sp. TRM95796]|uniref:aspartate/glutamate racemase family protein n=1 Tax=Rhizobium sp. TRM95796 TaxID=2979862 RepID=UPI0021E7A240|nr:aspartate/glutamate racemase family protein [Rhizobium sp. TRM95796]MCV3764517.1 aspartate/glutamate racemase family protein [Rhizobium sp. TRM95796]
MKKIGLIGGMSWESTAVYYANLNRLARAAYGGLASADILLRSVNFDEIVTLQKAGRWDKAAAVLSDAAAKLQLAGADCVLICTNTMHKVADEVEAAVSVPLLHIIDETALALKAAGKRKPLLLATRYTMEDGFYHRRFAQHGLDLATPDESGRARTHAIIFEELCAGHVLDGSRTDLTGLIEAAKDQGCDSVILGCTEICLSLDPEKTPLPGFDSTAIHCDAAARFAFPKQMRLSA